MDTRIFSYLLFCFLQEVLRTIKSRITKADLDPSHDYATVANQVKLHHVQEK